MQPGFYTYKLSNGELAIAMILADQPAGVADCILFTRGKQTGLYYRSEEMAGEWGEMIEFVAKRQPAEVNK